MTDSTATQDDLGAAERSSFFANLANTLGVQHSAAVETKGRPTLQLDAKGPDVQALQTILGDVGVLSRYTVGEFGTSTQTAVVQFQLRVGLRGTGIADAPTWEALGRAQKQAQAAKTVGSLSTALAPMLSSRGETVTESPVLASGQAPAGSWVPYAVGGVALVGVLAAVGYYVASRPRSS